MKFFCKKMFKFLRKKKNLVKTINSKINLLYRAFENNQKKKKMSETTIFFHAGDFAM